MKSDPLTDFGFREVPFDEKTQRVDEVFRRVAPYYDRMNNVLSLGLHKLWKRTAVLLGNVRGGMSALDLAAGGGDVAALLRTKVGGSGRVCVADINLPMLNLGRENLRRKKSPAAANFVQCRGENLPFADGSFDRVFIAFGLRNIADRDAALREMRRVLRPGGRCVVLEFSPPARNLSPLAAGHRFYLLRVLPFLGKCIADDGDSYRYLGESIVRFPTRRQLAAQMRGADFDSVDCVPLAAGAVAVHRGWRLN